MPAGDEGVFLLGAAAVDFDGLQGRHLKTSSQLKAQMVATAIHVKGNGIADVVGLDEGHLGEMTLEENIVLFFQGADNHRKPPVG